MKLKFGDLHSHSDYSIFDGFAKISDKVEKAKELGYDALAMTEHGTTTGLVSFYLECKESGIKPILGYEGYFTFEPDVKAGNTYHILLLAKNLEGYKNILRISSYASQHFYKKPRIGIECLEKYSEGIICSTACVAGLTSIEDKEMMQELFKKLHFIFKDDFYLEIQPHDFDMQKEHNRWAMNFCKENNYQIVVTGDSHYVSPEDRMTHRAWISLQDDSEYYSSGDYHLQSEKEMRGFFVGEDKEMVDKAFQSVHDIIEKCNVEIPMGEKNYPVFDTESPDAYIRNRCNEGWFKKGINKKANKQEYKNQVLHELNVLETCGYKNYFCIIDDLLKWCRENNIATGIGRGSVGGSTVAYLMDITDVDPIKYNLVFERFANPERVTDCDIDLDVASEKRDRVIDYVREKYGEVHQIRTIGYISDKASIQRAGKALGIPPSETTKISKSINTIDELPDSELKDLAKKFLGHIQNYGKHASAVVVFPREAENWCAIEKQEGSFVAAQDFHLLEKQGIMKLDILGLETLDVIEHTIDRIGKDIDLSSIDLKDEKTAKMLRNGLTEGCFQISSKVMTGIIQAIKTKSELDLVDTVALGRPGILDVGMDKEFIKRRNGGTIEYLHPKLEPILKDTEGIILYQEQIMRIVRELCNFSYGKSDNIRRIIGRKIIEEMHPAIEEIVKEGVKNGIEEKTMRDICSLIETFANYGFNKSHAVAYGITAWRTAWLKANYPKEYMASLIDSASGEKDKLLGYIEHAKKLGIKVEGPDVFSGKELASINGDTIQLGFNVIAGVGNTTVPLVTDESDAKEYLEKYSSLNKTVLKNLVRSGALDCISDCTRWELLEYIEWLKDKRKSRPAFAYTGEEGESYAEMEFSTIGWSSHDPFAGYDFSLANGTNIIPINVVSVKPHKTRKGKPMIFIKAKTKDSVAELVMFDGDFKGLEKGKVYIVDLQDTIIKSYIPAKKLN